MNTSAQFSRSIADRPGLYVVRKETQQRSASLISPAAAYEFNAGRIPELRDTCMKLYRLFSAAGVSQSAIHAIPVLRSMDQINPVALQRFLENPKTSHTLVNNSIMKIVLIKWPKGKLSSVHGHPKGGCMFKVLSGKVEELRYSPDASRKLMSAKTYHAGSMSYIDDETAFHAVGNPYDQTAVSLHVYTYSDRANTLPEA